MCGCYDDGWDQMISIEQIFNSKEKLLRYRESYFYPTELLTFSTGLLRPVLFVANKQALEQASFFSIHKIEDTDYDVHVVSGQATILFYLIDIKVAASKVVPNGILLRRRPPSESDKDGVKVKYTLEHFFIISNRLGTCTMFARDVTADPTT